jgi:uncharacterized membrane protein (DUF2068 family)
MAVTEIEFNKGLRLKLANRLGIRAIALFEGGKAMLMLIALLTFIFDFHLNAQDLAETLVGRLHIDPQDHYVTLLLKVAESFSGGELTAVCVCAFMYSVIKFSESIGLWNQRPWGRTLGIASIGVLIPYEVYALFHQYTHFKLIILLINTSIVLYLFMFFNRHTTLSSSEL